MVGPRILVVDDEIKLLSMLQRMLQAAGFTVVTAATCPDALASAAQHQPDAVILDLHIDQGSGAQLAARLRESMPVPIVLMTGALLSDQESAQAMRYVHNILYKPFDMSTLVSTVHACLAAA
jgi:DNA-binding response OmpR family regulator